MPGYVLVALPALAFKHNKTHQRNVVIPIDLFFAFRAKRAAAKGLFIFQTINKAINKTADNQP